MVKFAGSVAPGVVALLSTRAAIRPSSPLEHGIHFRFDQDAGDWIGRQVATYVFKHLLRPVPGRP